MMAAPSKFTRARAATVVEILAAGGSRREAARRVGIDHATLGRWIRRGDKVAGSGSRFATFAEAVHLAETPSDPPILVPLRDKSRPTRAEVDEAWRFLERTEFARPEPVEVEVVLGPTIGHQGDSA